MRFFKRFAACIIGLTGLSLGFQALSLGSFDPSADFSFSLNPSVSTGAYQLLANRRIAELFAQRTVRQDSEKLAQHFLEVCRRYRFNPAFVLSLINAESGFNPEAVSPAGAVGLMQLMPGTARWLVRERQLPKPRGASRGLATFAALKDPYWNVTLGVAYLAYLREQFPGISAFDLLAAYRMGPGNLPLIEQARRTRGIERAYMVESRKYFQMIRRGFSEIHGGFGKIMSVRKPASRKLDRKLERKPGV